MRCSVRRTWNVPESRHTAESVYRDRRRHRRDFLRGMGISAAGAALAPLLNGCSQPTDAEIAAAGQVEPLADELSTLYPATRNAAFEYGRPETLARAPPNTLLRVHAVEVRLSVRGRLPAESLVV